MDIGVLRRDGRTDPFFDGTARERLVVRRCEACDRWFAPDAAGCPGCGDEELGWAEASGDAALVTWTVTHGRPAADGTVPPRPCSRWWSSPRAVAARPPRRGRARRAARGAAAAAVLPASGRGRVVHPLHPRLTCG
ncbi:Zn-ribbon domain-containing OB-fold protein [Actinomadura sp. J1-007]|uniref:Zn-ribbon domain-containing OB-fold protein n=1 Tax=Actinomadura sp. J1-007 TaxID=2661913 RepID=UPI0035CD1AFD